jgi:tetratricopeptide (TPR) repeat protein
MDSNLTETIKHELSLHDTEELVEIWQTNNGDEWTDEAFAVIEKILMDRLGYLPPQEDWEEADRRLEAVQQYLDVEDLDQAFKQTDLALEAGAHYGMVYYVRGLVLDEMGRLGESVDAFQKAIELDPDLSEAKKELGYVLKEYENEERRKGSPTDIL